jgi:hypothetical protein
MSDAPQNERACPQCGHEHAGIDLAFICIGCPCPETPGKPADEDVADRAMDRARSGEPSNPWDRVRLRIGPMAALKSVPPKYESAPRPPHRWRHTICASCYGERFPGREPIRIKPEYAELASCCFCGKTTGDGIYVRAHVAEAKHCPDHKAAT